MRAQATRDGRDDRGQATVWLVALLAVGAAGLLLLGQAGELLADHARARAAADAAALAGAEAGRAEAERVALANGGVLLEWIVEGAEREVVVRVGEAEAVARARAWREPVGQAGREPVGRVSSRSTDRPVCSEDGRRATPCGPGRP